MALLPAVANRNRYEPRGRTRADGPPIVKFAIAFDVSLPDSDLSYREIVTVVGYVVVEIATEPVSASAVARCGRREMVAVAPSKLSAYSSLRACSSNARLSRASTSGEGRSDRAASKAVKAGVASASILVQRD